MTEEAILVLNAGSSTLKLALYGADGQRRYVGLVDNIRFAPSIRIADASGSPVYEAKPEEPSHHAALQMVIGWLDERGGELKAVGHRVVHGGEAFSQPVVVTPDVLQDLQELIPLAPLHQPHNLEAIRWFLSRRPLLPQIACFDTAFHRTQPWVNRQYAIPRWLAAEGVERYGFHGLSYEYIASVLPEYLGEKAEGKVVVAHLGNGASLCAMQGRKSIATSMGFTALDGLMMGTRSGDIDPGVLLYLMQEHEISPEQIMHLLYEESGLKGVSGISHDMRDLLASSEPEAKEAVELYITYITRQMGAMAALLGGLDAIVFTGGVGENSAPIRDRVMDRMRWLCDDVHAIKTDEEQVILRAVRQCKLHQ